jgi:hypothetical protein
LCPVGNGEIRSDTGVRGTYAERRSGGSARGVARVVGVHGIGQQTQGEHLLAADWVPAMRDGVQLAGGELASGDVRCAFYGDLFRPPGRTLAVGDPWLTTEDATEDDAELLLEWWREAARVDEYVIDPDARALARTPDSVQAALRALSASVFFAGLADRVMLFDLAQVRRYLTKPDTRQAVQERVEAVVGPDTRVLVGHSLGSVVAYEALCAHPEWPVRALVTLGSPLGIRHLIFDRLVPAPTSGSTSVGRWPGRVETWTNVADAGDVVALEKDLKPQFGNRVVCHLVHNGSHAHDVRPYLTALETGKAIWGGLSMEGLPT